MTRKNIIGGIALVWLFGIALCVGQDEQQDAPPTRTKEATGSLSGSIYCADTDQPARLAQLYLIQISKDGLGSQKYGQTDLEGRFSMVNVPEGNYYVVAVLPGYVNLQTSLTKSQLDELSADERRSFLARIPTITISAKQPAQLSFHLERGAEIDGTVTYDDGSPAIGLVVNYSQKGSDLRHRSATEDLMGNPAVDGLPITDDRGRFRILGVPPGDYVVYATLLTRSSERAETNPFVQIIEGPSAKLNIYAADSLRSSTAETIKVTAGGAAQDADITIPLSKLHTIRGQVVLKGTGQPPAVANVQLLYADTEELVRSVIAPNGKFAIPYLPEGQFLVHAAAGAEPPPVIDYGDSGILPRAVSQYKWLAPKADADSPAVPLQITGDLDNLTIVAPDPSTNEKNTPIEINIPGRAEPDSSGNLQK